MSLCGDAAPEWAVGFSGAPITDMPASYTLSSFHSRCFLLKFGLLESLGGEGPWSYDVSVLEGKSLILVMVPGRVAETTEKAWAVYHESQGISMGNGGILQVWPCDMQGLHENTPH